MLKYIDKSITTVVVSSKGNPVLAFLTVFGYWGFFNIIEAMIETLIYGFRFFHFLDLIIALITVVYMCACTWRCAIYQASRLSKGEE